MSNESGHGQHQEPKSNQPAMSFKAAFWFIIILVGLFVCAVNFVKIESSETGEGKTEARTEKAVSENEMKPASTETKAQEKASDTSHSEKH